MILPKIDLPTLHTADHGTDAMEREKSLLLAQRGGDYLDYQMKLWNVSMQVVLGFVAYAEG